jgi:DNA-binding NarL/FixJ family response regulator
MERSLKKIHILLIEDNRLLRDGIASMLKKQTDMRVVAAVSSGENILGLMDKNKPDIVLLDLGLRSQNSLQIVKLIRQNFLEVKIIVMDLIPLQEDVMEFV